MRKTKEDEEAQTTKEVEDAMPDYVSESVCHTRTQAILDEVKCVKGATTNIDKAVAVLIAEKKGKDSALDRLVAYGKIVALLIALGGLVWGAATLSQPDTSVLAKAVAHEFRNGDVAARRGP